MVMSKKNPAMQEVPKCVICQMEAVLVTKSNPALGGGQRNQLCVLSRGACSCSGLSLDGETGVIREEQELLCEGRDIPRTVGCFSNVRSSKFLC